MAKRETIKEEFYPEIERTVRKIKEFRSSQNFDEADKLRKFLFQNGVGNVEYEEDGRVKVIFYHYLPNSYGGKTVTLHIEQI